EVVIDMEPLKGQSYSLIPWSRLDPSEWLDINKWLIGRSLKDKYPDWKLRLRYEEQQELMGKVLSCKGTCPIYRGTMAANGRALSRLQEGDEIRTQKDSVAW